MKPFEIEFWEKSRKEESKTTEGQMFLTFSLAYVSLSTYANKFAVTLHLSPHGNVWSSVIDNVHVYKTMKK